LLIICLLASCSTENNTKAEHKINKVTVAFSGYGCESECAFIAVSIDSNRKLNYYGGKYAKYKGYHQGLVSKEVWDSVQTQFSKFITSGIDTIDRNRTDQPMVEVQIDKNEDKWKIIENTGRMSDRDLNILYWFSRGIVDKIVLTKTDSLTFETKAQFGIPSKGNSPNENIRFTLPQ
jgi:hypothetical protein